MALPAVLMLVLGLAAPAAARDEQEDTRRLAGDDRVATAVELATTAFPDGTTTALLARQDAFPDALAASGNAGVAGAAVLLTAQDQLSDATAAGLEDLGVTDVRIAGGPTAIAESVEDQLREEGYDVTRVAGADRYATARELATAMEGEVGGIDGRGEQVAVLASGTRFPDALAAGPVAFAHRLPVLLTPSRGGLHPEAAAAIDELGIDHVVVVGGPVAVPWSVGDDLEGLGVSHERVAGRDRTETAAELATWAVRHAGFTIDDVVVARGDAFPDALAAAPLAGGDQHPVLLTRHPNRAGYELLQWVVDHADGTAPGGAIERVTALGGPLAIASDTLEHLAEAAAPPERVVRYAIDTAGDVTADVPWFARHVDWTLTDPRGWALGHDVRWDQVPDPADAEITIHLATPAVIGGIEGCSSAYSCQPAGTDDVYINEDNWTDATPTYREAGRTLDSYRHYVVIHEVGHAPPMNFGHIRCEDVYTSPTGEPSPVMEQQSIPGEMDPCTTRVWPLQLERDQARDALIGGGSTLREPDGATGTDETWAP